MRTLLPNPKQYINIQVGQTIRKIKTIDLKFIKQRRRRETPPLPIYFEIEHCQ